MKHAKVWFVVLAFLLLAITVPTVFAAGPTGKSPNDPLVIPTGWQSIAPNSTLWFYFDYATDRSRTRANVMVDANGASGLTLSVYSSAGVANWLQDPTTEPAGIGTALHDTSNGALVHDLYWSGGSKISDRFYVALANSSPAPISYLLSVTGLTVTLYPPIAPTPTPTLYVPFTVTPIQTGTINGKVVFETATGGAIWVVNGDGSSLNLVSHGIDPSWSPDGKKITFARWDNVYPGLYIANADGSNEQLAFGAPKIRWPRWSPDGKSIVFSQDRTRVDRTPIWKLGIVEVATGKLSEPQCSQQCFVPSWTKDGTTIVYTDPSIGILRTSVVTGPATLIGPTGTYWDTTANIPRPIVNWPPIQTSIVSPDGNHISFSMQTHDRWELNSMNIDGSNQIGITKPDPVQYYLLGDAVHNVAPVWSPDSQQILFLSDRNGKWEFFVTDPGGTNIKQVLKKVTDLVPLNFAFQNERMMDWSR